MRNFYPRPHMEGDGTRRSPFVVEKKFLPTPSHGGRLPAQQSRPTAHRFLPTPSHGGRPRARQRGQHPLRISTHALTWRATLRYNYRNCNLQNFYPRPHMEGDNTLSRLWLSFPNFYPRPHMEGDGRRSLPLQSLFQFLPTPSHGGRRKILPVRLMIVQISTHALTWRATLDFFKSFPIGRISTHALTWRATICQIVIFRNNKISTHALTWRATLRRTS